MRFAFIEAEKANEDVAWMCERLGLSASGSYAWRKRVPSTKVRRDEQLTVRIKAAFEASRRTYGSPRVLEDLREGGERFGRNRVTRLMRAEGLQARVRRRFKSPTMSDHGQTVDEEPDAGNRHVRIYGSPGRCPGQPDWN